MRLVPSRHHLGDETALPVTFPMTYAEDEASTSAMAVSAASPKPLRILLREAPRCRRWRQNRHKLNYVTSVRYRFGGFVMSQQGFSFRLTT